MEHEQTIGVPVSLQDKSGSLGVGHLPPHVEAGDCASFALGTLLHIVAVIDDGGRASAEVERVRLVLTG